MAETEIWRDIKGYEGIYHVSNLGRIKSSYPKTKASKNGGVLKLKLDDKGYYRVNLYKGRECRSPLVSRCVAEAFIENPFGLPHVGHMDDNRTNNRVDNLYWTNPYENNRHNGKLIRFQERHNEKIQIISQKLSVPVVGARISDGARLFFNSMQEAKAMGFRPCKISMCINGKRKTHGGYYWHRPECDDLPKAEKEEADEA